MYANPAQWAAGGGWQNHFTNQAGEGKFTFTNVLNIMYSKGHVILIFVDKIEIILFFQLIGPL